jgi:sugar-specific transcriptional regulator TrmB
MARSQAVHALRNLGFNQLESEVYVFLLGRPAVTAYAVGRSLGRPTANVYKAVESLARRGAVLVEEGDQRACRAVPVSELLRQLDHGYKATLQSAKDALAELELQSDDERVYRIESVTRLFERCRDMMAKARSVVVVDAFPRALERIRPFVVAACRRGVRVFVEAYAPVEIEGASVAVFPKGEETLAKWQSEQLNVVVDGREHVLALLSPELDEVRQGVWSNSLYLSCLHHAGRLCEHTLIGMLSAARDGDTAAVLKRLEEHGFFINSDVPGLTQLMERFPPTKTALEVRK